MARIARNRGVRAGEREMCCCMIKRSRAPTCLRMAGEAIVIKPCVDWIGRAGEVRLMAGIAIREYEVEISALMTTLARNGCVGTSQREVGRAVVKCRGCPHRR